MTHFHFPHYLLSSDSIAKHNKEKKWEKKTKTQPMNQNRCMIIQEGKSNRGARDFASLIRPIIWIDTDADADTITTTTTTSSSDDDDVLYRDRLRALRPLVEVITDTLPPRPANQCCAIPRFTNGRLADRLLLRVRAGKEIRIMRPGAYLELGLFDQCAL